MPRALLLALITALVGVVAVAPAADAARARHGTAKKKKRHRAAAAIQGSSTGLLRAPRGGRRPAAYGRLVAIAPASRPAVEATPVPVTPTLAPAAALPELPPPSAPGEALGSFASVRARDSATNFSFTLSRPALAAGPVRLQLQNSGEDPHDLTVEPAAGGASDGTTGIVTPGGTGSIVATLPAGQYRLYCSLFDHAARGMQATLDVR